MNTWAPEVVFPSDRNCKNFKIISSAYE